MHFCSILGILSLGFLANRPLVGVNPQTLDTRSKHFRRRCKGMPGWLLYVIVGLVALLLVVAVVLVVKAVSWALIMLAVMLACAVGLGVASPWLVKAKGVLGTVEARAKAQAVAVEARAKADAVAVENKIAKAF